MMPSWKKHLSYKALAIVNMVLDQHPDFPEDSPRYGQGSPHGQDVAYVFMHLDPENPPSQRIFLTCWVFHAFTWIHIIGNQTGLKRPRKIGLRLSMNWFRVIAGSWMGIIRLHLKLESNELTPRFSLMFRGGCPSGVCSKGDCCTEDRYVQSWLQVAMRR